MLSSTSPIAPPGAVPAFEIKISIPPNFSQICLKAFLTLFLFVTSQCMQRSLILIAFLLFFANYNQVKQLQLHNF